MTTIGFRGPDGQRAPLGGVNRKYVDADFSTGALPATVVAGSGTASFPAMPSAVGAPSGSYSRGSLLLTSAATTASEAMARATPIFRTSDYKVIRGRVQGWKLDAANPLIAFYVRFRGTSNILSFGQEYNATPAVASVQKYGESAVNTQYNLCAQGTNRGAKLATIEIGLSFLLKEGYVQVGDADPFAFPMTAQIDHLVRFEVGVITRENAAHTLSLDTMEAWGEYA